MKNIFLIIISLTFTQFVSAQLKTTPACPPFVVDILEGTVNEMYPKSAIGEIKAALPCFTESLEDATTTSCTGVFFKDKDIYFYTGRNYIEIGANYKGKMNPALMGTARSGLFNLLGHPKIKDVSWDAFQMQYGTLIVYYDKAGKINKLQLSSKDTNSIKLCE